MPKKTRKSSGRITLVLIGVAALAGCGGERRDLYATREDCLADWANTPSDCARATDPGHAARGYWYGPSYYHSGPSWMWGSHGTRSIGSTSHHAASSGSSHSSSGVSRGGFGSSGHSSSG